MLEKIIQTKICKQCDSEFEITDRDLEFYKKVSPVFGGKKFQVPTPTFCPDCRQQRRLSFRNERKLYKRKCDLCENNIISIYSPDKQVIVYCNDCWWGDKWNPLDYGVDFDFSKSFFEQLMELMIKVPRINLVNEQNENSPYVNYTSYNKNIYLAMDVMNSENIYYANTIKNVKNGVDLTDIENSEFCYECISSSNLYKCYYTFFSQDCDNCIGLHSCKNTRNSLFCTNLIDKEYYIFNRKSSKQEVEELKKTCEKGNILAENLRKFYELIFKSPKKNLSNINVENCLGNNLYNSQNSIYCFEGINIKECKYCVVAHSMNDCMDTTIHNPDCFLDYEAVCGGLISNSLFNITGRKSNNIIYCDNCYYSSYLFGCVRIYNHKQYCILNKQYTKKQYEELVSKIIEHMQNTGEWGEFFPSLLSPFGYNETVANEYFPLTKTQVLEKGFNWSDYDPPFPKVEKIIPANKLPNNIKDIPDDILNWAVECEITKKPFRILRQELDFYRKHKLPIPRIHPDQRHLDRMALRNPRKLYERKCDKCSRDIKSTYSPDREEIVYCEKCYNNEVY